MTTRPQLLTVEDSKHLPAPAVSTLFRDHVNPGQLHFMKLLGLHRVIVDRAEGMYYIERGGRRILDFFGGFGSLALGHNHPRILAARMQFQDERRHEICMAFMSQYATALACNLARISPGDLEMVFLGSTGSEAVEAAIKVAEQRQGPARSKIIYAEQSFHGKTKGALALTDSSLYRSNFRLPEGGVRVPFGDLAEIEAVVDEDPAVGAILLETIQGGAGVVQAPAEFWTGVRTLCDRKELLWIADEVQCGIGRTGRFYAFEHLGVSPDVVVLAKSLGGGKSAISAMITRRDVFMKAFGKPKTALIHGPATFSGMGESCITAIETLHVLYDEGLMDNAAVQGAYLIERLERLKERYPRIIKDVRGRGLMIGLELCDFSETLPPGIRQAVSVLDDRLKGTLCGFIGRLLLEEYDILVAFTEYNRNVIRLEPPLIVGRKHVDRFVGALDSLLSRGVRRIATDFVRRYTFNR